MSINNRQPTNMSQGADVHTPTDISKAKLPVFGAPKPKPVSMVASQDAVDAAVAEQAAAQIAAAEQAAADRAAEAAAVETAKADASRAVVSGDVVVSEEEIAAAVNAEPKPKRKLFSK